MLKQIPHVLHPRDTLTDIVYTYIRINNIDQCVRLFFLLHAKSAEQSNLSI